MKKLANVIIGLVIGIFLLAISYAFLSASQKTDYGTDYYGRVDFDFIIPAPWFDQIPDIKSKEFVDDVTPYYLTEKTVSSKDKSAEIYIYLVDEDANIGITSFSKKFLVNGEVLKKDGIVIDESVKNLLGVSVGEKISVQIGSKAFDFTVNGVVQSNKFASKLSSIAYLSDDIKAAYEKAVKHTVYSAAFVKANNLVEAENYFNTEYRAMGKAGERDWYKDDDTYKFARNSALETPVGKEVTNIAQIKANVASNTNTAEKLNMKNLLFAALSVFVVNIIAWLVVIFSQRKKIKTVDQGKGGATSAEIINDFRFGEIATFLVFLLSALLFKTIANYIQIAILLVCGLLSLLMTFSMTKQLFQSPQNQQTNKEKTQTQKIPQEKERRRKDSKQ